MSVSGNSHSTIIVVVLSAAMLGLMVWCAHGLWGQMKVYGLEKQMRSLHLSVCQYAMDYNNYCPDDLGALIDSGYCTDGKMYRVEKDGDIPKKGEDVRNGLCDFTYLGKGMKLDVAHKVGQAESASFPLLYLNVPVNGEWLVLYGDGRCEAYETLPAFLKTGRK